MEWEMQYIEGIVEDMEFLFISCRGRGVFDGSGYSCEG